MSSRATAERFSCLLTSTRAGRPPTSSGHPRTPGVSSMHTNGLSRSNPTSLQRRWKEPVSKSVTKEPRCRHPGKQNVGIMRFLLAGSVPFWAFVTDLDTVGRLVGEDGGPLGSPSSAVPTWARSAPCHLAGCEQRSRTQISLPRGLPAPGGEPGPRGRVSPLRRPAPPSRTALRGEARRRPTPQSALRAG